MPPFELSASIFTAPNVERHRPSTRPASICCGGGGPPPCGWPYCGIIDAFWLLFWFADEPAEPAATTTAAPRKSSRVTLPRVMVAQYSAVSRFRPRQCCGRGVVVSWQPDSVPLQSVRCSTENGTHGRRAHSSVG